VLIGSASPRKPDQNEEVAEIPLFSRALKEPTRLASKASRGKEPRQVVSEERKGPDTHRSVS
jgi:hypothetical protein